MSTEPSTSAPPAPPEDNADNLAVIARQAIVDEHRAVFGYELFDRSTASDAHNAASDAALLFNALSYADTNPWSGKSWCLSTAPTKASRGGT